MHSDLEQFFHRSEDRYLQQPEMIDFQHHIGLLAKRLDTYKCLRDREIDYFQPVAEKLLQAFPQDISILERALTHWLSVMRYCAMAMLLNNPEFLQHRLLEWLADIVQAHEIEALEQHLYQLLQAQLKRILSEEQLALVNPFLRQAQTVLLAKKTSSESQALTIGGN